MFLIKSEKVKQYILVILVITSIIQVGVLWNYQRRGMPTNFLWNIISAKNNQVTIDMEDFFRPFKIVVSAGFENPHWVINEDDSHYDEVWKNAKYYLKNIISSKKIISEREFLESQWKEVIEKKSVIIEFKNDISSNLIAAFLGVGASGGLKAEKIYKMAILPAENINNNVNIYIYTGEKVYLYTMGFFDKGLSRGDYDLIIEELYGEGKESFEVVSELIRNTERSPFYFKPDVLIVAKGNKYRNFNNVISSIPYDMPDLDSKSSTDIDVIAEEIIGNEKDSYIQSVDMSNVVVFKNFSNRYNIYKDGLLEYKYLSVIGKRDKGNEIEAFKKALEFIKVRENLISDVDIYLAKMVDEGEYYTFYFDYKFNNLPVVLNGYPIKNSGKKLNHAINISANSKRVLSCEWVLRKFEVGNNVLELNMNFGDLLDDTFERYTDLASRGFSIKDKNVSYEIKYSVNTESILPTWVIETIDDRRYIVPMKQK
jgi:hypothetical protein